MTDLEHLEAEIARCQKFVDMLSGGKKSGGNTGTLERFIERRDALQRIREEVVSTRKAVYAMGPKGFSPQSRRRA